MKFQELVQIIEQGKHINTNDECILVDAGTSVKYYDSKTGKLQYYETKRYDEVTIDRNGFMHNDNGPARIAEMSYVEVKYEYAKHGLTHRLDGPAEYYMHKGSIVSEDQIYAINGKEYSMEEYYKIINALGDQAEDVVDISQLF